jgi:hypothetical protein
MWGSFIIGHYGRLAGLPTALSLIPACGIPEPGSSGEQARRRVAAIIGVRTVAGMISDLRKTVNAWAMAEELSTGIRTVYAVFRMPINRHR